MIAIEKKIHDVALSNDVKAYYAAVYEYSAVGLSAVDNPVVTQIIRDLLPAIRRIHYVSLLNQTQNLLENSHHFRELTECMKNRDPDGGEKVIRQYITNEKRIALSAIEGF